MRIWNFKPENEGYSGSSYGLPEIKVQGLRMRLCRCSLNSYTEHGRQLLSIDVSFLPEKGRFDQRLFELGVCDLERGGDCFGQEKHFYQAFDILIDQFKTATEEEQMGSKLWVANHGEGTCARVVDVWHFDFFASIITVPHRGW